MYINDNLKLFKVKKQNIYGINTIQHNLTTVSISVITPKQRQKKNLPNTTICHLKHHFLYFIKSQSMLGRIYIQDYLPTCLVSAMKTGIQESDKSVLVRQGEEIPVR